MKGDEVFIRHMIDAIDEMERILEKISFIDFVNDSMRMHAAVRLFEILGEAASKLTPACRAQHPEIPFGDIIGMRNKLIHHYIEVDLETLWQTYKEDVPRLRAALKAIIADI